MAEARIKSAYELSVSIVFQLNFSSSMLSLTKPKQRKAHAAIVKKDKVRETMPFCVGAPIKTSFPSKHELSIFVHYIQSI